MKKMIIEESFWNVLPDARIAVMVVSNMKRADEVPEADTKEIAKLLAQANAAADQHLTSNTISQNQVVVVWREAYKTFKTKKGARCSIENLLKRVLKGNPVGAITPSVDIYNAISLKYALSVGGEDLDTIVGDFRLGMDAEGGMDFLPLGEEASDPTLPGEMCYYDEAGAVCRCFNWRDGQRTQLTDSTQTAVLIMESVDPERAGDLQAGFDELAALLERYLGATVQAKQVLTREQPEMVLVP